jgi:hypothetical protein
MNKTLLKQLIREEIKNVLEQMSDDKMKADKFAGSDPKAGSTIQGTGFNWKPKNKENFEVDTDPTQAIEKMADALDVDVSVHLGAGYNKLTFRQRKDVDEKTFERMIQFLERIGYNVDLGQSDRTHDFEPGERDYYPRIVF